MRPHKGTGVPAQAFLYLTLILYMSLMLLYSKSDFMYNISNTSQTACYPLMTSCSLIPSICSSMSLISIYAYKNIEGGRLTQGVTCPRLSRLLEMPQSLLAHPRQWQRAAQEFSKSFKMSTLFSNNHRSGSPSVPSSSTVAHRGQVFIHPTKGLLIGKPTY